MGLLQVLDLPTPRSRTGQGTPAAKVGGAAAASPARSIAALEAAVASWLETHRIACERIAALKASVKAHYSASHPEFLPAIEQGLQKLDVVMSTVDHRLAHSLANAGKATDDAARKAELKRAKAILAEYIAYVKGESLVAHIDSNPFEVKTDLKALLVTGLTNAAKAIG
jgi:hypothetical protein